MAFGESTLSQKSVYKWYKRFTKGREDVDDDEHPGGATTSTSEENIETEKNCFWHETSDSEVCSEKRISEVLRGLEKALA